MNFHNQERLPYRALLSVSDKSALEELARFLIDMGWEIVATDGTAGYLEEKEINVTRVSKLLGFSQCLGHRVKTLDLRILGGLLWDKNNAKHNQEVKKLDFIHFDLLVASFYPFEKAVQKDYFRKEPVIEYIDIGGPTMLRSAAKNFNSVIPLVKKEDYKLIINKLKKAGGSPNGISSITRRKLALTAFKHLIHYDNTIASYLENWNFEGI